MIWIVSIILAISIAINCILCWYVIKLLENVSLIYDDNRDLLDTLQEYSDHVSNVYELETFYGDETLSHLLNHTKELTEFLEKYNNAALFKQEEDYDEEDYDEENYDEKNT